MRFVGAALESPHDREHDTSVVFVGFKERGTTLKQAQALPLLFLGAGLVCTGGIAHASAKYCSVEQQMLATIFLIAFVMVIGGEW